MAASVRRARLALLIIAVAALTGCGGDDGEGDGGASASELAVPWVDPDGEPPYIGSLSINPADSSLFMGTNTGLFRIPDGGSEPEKVTGQLETPDGSGQVSESLVAQFTGPDTLIGSGHPSAGAALPPALGLIRSGDAGKTWESVSELGRVDFHALRQSGDRLVGALFGQAQVLVSGDEGRTWETRTAPMPLVDLALDPENPDHWVGTAERGLFITTDGGQSWRQRDPIPNIRLAWPAGGDLHRVEPGGPVNVSSDGGETWEDRGSTGGEPHAMTVAEDGTVYVALLDGTVKASTDGGQTFTDQVKGG
ncbi:MAG: WD40/YVTN/BNR-like repeat-containing protein [Solirubrobacteraceae bacterium]